MGHSSRTVPTSVSDEDEDWFDTSVSSHVEVPVLAFNTDVVFENERTVGDFLSQHVICSFGVVLRM